MAFYRWCLFAKSAASKQAASSVCATTYILIHHQDGLLYTWFHNFTISANTLSITIRISTSGGTGCVIAIGRAAICIHYPQCGLYPAPLCSVWNVQSTLRVLPPSPRIRRLYPQWVLIAPTTTTTIPHCGGNCSGGKAKHLLSCLINTIQHTEDMVITTWLTKSQWYICVHKFCWGVTFYVWCFLFVTFDMPSFAIVTFDMPPFYICDI